MIELLMIAGAAAAGLSGLVYSTSERGKIRRRARKILRKIDTTVKAAGDPVGIAQAQLQSAAKLYRDELRQRAIDQLPVETLKEYGATGVRWSAIRSAGITSLGDLSRSSEWTHRIQGVGTTSLERMNSAITSYNEVHEHDAVALPDVTSWRQGAAKDLVKAAWAVVQAKEIVAPKRERLREAAAANKEAWRSIDSRTTFLEWLVGSKSPEVFEELRGRLEAEEGRLAALEADGLLEPQQWACVPRPPDDDTVEIAFRSRNADFVALIEAALSGKTGSGLGSATGNRVARGLPDEIAQRAERFPLDESGLKATLRQYQRFGAKYMLAQERTVIGDEMGLGKTVQALAAISHIESKSPKSHFLVVCPASITLNWLRETDAKSMMRPALLHGANRDRELALWEGSGGVAITSFSTLGALDLPARLTRHGIRVRMLTIDEAHYVKNPDTQRRRAVEAIMPHSEHVTLMTGTPLENRLDEFRSIVGLVSADVATRIPDRPTAFTKLAERVAPVYLRRNQEDVLTELPERIEKEEWLDLTQGDHAAYVDAVRNRNYMAMRRAVTIGSGDGKSAKVSRVAELIDEYRDLDRKVVIFSFFLDVLQVLERRFGATGTIRGGVAPAARTAAIDRFQEQAGHAILLSQVEAGGVGINLQAASVVILMEPQWKPSTEVQAIARAHRMGQTEHVIVHRMLARESVDEKMVALLAHKQAIFDASVRDSAVKDATSEATEEGFAKSIVESEYARLATAA